ncbi:30S ribosomal protein S16 [Patescibacteria group bacterium]
MLIIRLIKTGKKNSSSFRVILTQKTAGPKSGKALEILGSYNPRLKETSLKKERIQYWLSQGVKTSDTVHNLLISQEVIKGDKIKKKIRLKKKGETEDKNEESEKEIKSDEKDDKSEETKEESNIDKSDQKSKIEKE